MTWMQGSLHQHGIDPASELEPDLPQRTDHLEPEPVVERD
jgi:hypothetical protein